MDRKSYEQKMTASMKERTGKTLEEWVELVKQTMPPMKTGRLKWLKNEYGLNQNSAYLILNQIDHGDKTHDELNQEYLENQFTGDNEALRPLYEEISRDILKLGEGIEIRPCKTYLPFYKKKQFMMIKPHKGNLHIGLALSAPIEHPKLLSPKGLGANARITQQFMIKNREELTADLWDLIQLSYQEN